MLRPPLAALAAALVVAAPAAAADFDDPAYWSFADQMAQRLDANWDAGGGSYNLPAGGAEPMSNSMILLTYSGAAMSGHVGPARNDARAGAIAAKLVAP